MGTKASQTMHVEYMVKPMYFASLKFSGILRVLKAYRVHIRMSIMLYTNDIISEKVETRQVSTAVSGYGWISFVSGGSMINQAIAPIS